MINIFFNIFCNLKLEFKLSNEKLQNSILFNLFADLLSTIDADTGDDPDEIDHVDGIDAWMVADMWGLFGREFVPVILKVHQL